MQLCCIVPLIENPPWTRRTADGQWQKLVDSKWVDYAPADLLTLTKTEGQLWLALFHIVCNNEIRKRYHFNSFRKGQLLRARKYAKIRPPATRPLPPPPIPHTRSHFRPRCSCCSQAVCNLLLDGKLHTWICGLRAELRGKVVRKSLCKTCRKHRQASEHGQARGSMCSPAALHPCTPPPPPMPPSHRSRLDPLPFLSFSLSKRLAATTPPAHLPRYINEILLDQLPVLADVQRFMDELSLMEVLG